MGRRMNGARRALPVTHASARAAAASVSPEARVTPSRSEPGAPFGERKESRRGFRLIRKGSVLETLSKPFISLLRPR